MTRILLASLAFVAAASPASAAERRYTVTDFDRVEVQGPFAVTLATGRAGSAIATGSHAAIERVSIEVQGRTLRVRSKSAGGGGYPGDAAGAVAIALGTHDLRGVAVAGSGKVIVDKAKGLRFDISLSGNGRIEIGSVDADRLTLGLIGGGGIKLAGKAKHLRATVSGAGNLEASGLAVEDAEINADTAGTVAVGVRRTAKVTATGSGDVEIAGAPACTVKALGAGQVTCGAR